ncbi:RimK family protein [Blastochloris viridis]|uniref:Alpha-aminoadipate--lysW ligase lysX n=1 Tax=Blastochloris viridis TaxID=1079 RepID=A0A0H5BNZ3_BLAVI|nr:RimK family protein [Blastochloris viridis]ALK08247.1 Ribosomal protein S6 modification protein [Blastochloris viridis]BAR98488.1 ribosomal protein S6 glutaminyl transferase related protein [Blastochloris viridis]CUU44169.1 Alpha-aminoadipate--lysW ligase lysX [Blastochloris viridis]
MTGWVIIVDQPKDFRNADTPHKVITTSEYLARPRLFDSGRPKLINLSRSYNYQSQGYYASLLAEARGHRVMPTVETMLELREATLYEKALPELEDELNRCARKTGWQPASDQRLMVCFGLVADERFEAFGKLLFDWFRCPAIEVSLEPGTDANSWISIARLRARPITKLENGDARFFAEALHAHTRRDWRRPKARAVAKYDLAVLHDPQEKLPPSSTASIRHLARVAEKMSVSVQTITRRQLSDLAEYDALFIRETTSIDNHTYRFARLAVQQGMPVIDDPISMIRCTNKVYLMEKLGGHDVAMPPTLLLSGEDGELEQAIDELGLPLVVKIPDGSFSRGVVKVATPEELKRVTEHMFEDTDLVIAQKFMPTEYDWRVGVLGGEPLFACQYMMARGHWQILKHEPNGIAKEGGFRTLPVATAPPDVIDLAVRACRLIGNGLYGVDIKQTNGGIYVIEVNDNPNIEHGVEDAAEKDAVWQRLVGWFVKKLEG